jgi:hypothetical protein
MSLVLVDTESERIDINEEDTVGKTAFAREDSTLNGGAIGDAIGDSFIWVDRLGGLSAAEEFSNELFDLGDTGRATEEDDLRMN